MKILGIIPARGGSKGIPKKNIKLLNNKPLIAYTIEPALISNLDEVIVSTDCDEIAEVSKRYKCKVIKRPSVLAEDTSPTLPTILHVLQIVDKKYDAVMILQPTSPLREVEDINNSIDIFNNNPLADSLVSVVDVPHNFVPEKLMKLKDGYLEHYIDNTTIKRRQEVDKYYARNGAAIYITKVDKLEEYIVGGKILPYFMGKLKSIDIDDIDDWNLVEKLLR